MADPPSGPGSEARYTTSADLTSRLASLSKMEYKSTSRPKPPSNPVSTEPGELHPGLRRILRRFARFGHWYPNDAHAAPARGRRLRRKRTAPTCWLSLALRDDIQPDVVPRQRRASAGWRTTWRGQCHRFV